MEITAAILAVGSMFLLYRLLYTGFEEFVEAMRFWMTPDCISFFRGEGIADILAEMKLFFIIIYGILVYAGVCSIGG